MSHWTFAISFSLVLVALVIWGATAVLCWLNWRRRGGKVAAMLEGLRFLIATLLVITLLRPEFVRILQRTERPEVAILLDASGSMATRDVATGSNATTRAEWLQQKRQAGFWKPLEKNARVVLEDFSRPQPATNGAVNGEIGTDISEALETVAQRENNLKAVLLLTDGDWNLGKPPLNAASRFREADVPIFTVGVGRETPMPDLILEQVSAPSYGLQGEQISIPYRIQSHLPREVKTSLILQNGDREETRKDITIPAQGLLQDSIVWSPLAMGEFTLTLRLPVDPAETVTNNNAQTFRIAIRADSLKVLVVDSLPRWEYRYLRNALERDPGIEMNCILFHPGMEPGSGRHYLPSFPGTKEALSKYDVVFLGDIGVGEGELSEKDAELLKGLVEQQASGLVFMPGRRGRELSFLKSSLKDLVPVVFEEGKPEGVSMQSESKLALSTLGKGHLLTRFDADENRNDEIWKGLPGFFWSAAVEKARPGSEVIAVHSSLRNSWGREPVLATRPAGSGKVLFMGTDSAWRWRRGVEDKFHYRFWGQVVRWMAHQRHLAEKQGVRLTFSPETPRTGDTVFLQATVLDANGFPLERGSVSGKITTPGGRSERLDFAAVEGGWGVFKSSFIARDGGQHKVVLTAEEQGRNLETEILVSQPQREKIGQPANLGVLRELASVSHGISGSVQDLDHIVQQISLLPEPKPIEQRIRLWSSPWWGGLILLLLGIYWTARKLAGMV